jgi:hypothetical protein
MSASELRLAPVITPNFGLLAGEISEICAAHHIPDPQDKVTFHSKGSTTEGLDVQEQCD